MPKHAHRIPSYRRHRGSGQAVVKLDGRVYYLGRHGSKASKAEYDRLIAEWLAGGGHLPNRQTDLTVNEVVLAFVKYAEKHYRRNDGKPSQEVARFNEAVRLLRPLYEHTLASEFGPLALKAVREKMIQEGWCRWTVNAQVGRIKRIFRWAVSDELLPPRVHQALQAVEGLRKGRSDARESRPVRPAPAKDVEAVLPLVSRQAAAMIRLQLLTGMRPGEVCMMRLGDLDRSSTTWSFTPATHKTEHHGHRRIIYLGPRAVMVLRPFLDREANAFLFDPREAEAERQEKRAQERKTPRWPSHAKFDQKRRKRRQRKGRTWPVRAYFTTATYRRCIQRACTEASVDVWTPHRLRHTAATQIRKDFGLDAARAILGHRTPVVTEVYAEIDGKLASEVMAKIG